MKIKVAVIFGGSSVEHEISIISASQVIQALDKNKYEVLPIYISKESDFYYSELFYDIANFKNLDEIIKKADKIILKKEKQTIEVHKSNKSLFKNTLISNVDIFFPVVHGTYGEDGRLQGMLEMLKATFVGCETKGAVNGQDKVFMKNILRDNGIDVVAFSWFYNNEYINNNEKIINKIKIEVQGPWIVKPASLGSSVGISKANNEEELRSSIEEALKYDFKVIVEQAITNLCEVNCAVIGDYSNQKASIIEEVIQSDEILSYSDKYESSGKSQGMVSAQRIIPARIAEEISNKIKEISCDAFRILNLAGNTRIDFLIDKDTNTIYLNETNTIPGSLAFYLWEKTDLDFSMMCDDMIKLAVKRKREEEQYTFSFKSNVLSNFSGTKGVK